MKGKETTTTLISVITVGLATLAIWQTSNLWKLQTQLSRPYLSMVPVFMQEKNNDNLALIIEIENIGGRPASDVVFINNYIGEWPEYKKLSGGPQYFINDIPPGTKPKIVNYQIQKINENFKLLSTKRYMVVQLCYRDKFLGSIYTETVYSQWPAIFKNDEKKERMPWAHITTEEIREQLDKNIKKEFDELKVDDQQKIKKRCYKKDFNINLLNIWNMFF